MSGLVRQIELKYREAENVLAEMRGRVKLLTEQKEESEKQLRTLNVKYKDMGEVLDSLRVYASLKEQTLREKLDNIVTQGLRLIFGEGYKSKLEFDISRGQAVIKPKIVTEVNGKELEADVADAHGGGLVNIVSVIYQILILSLVKPRQRRVLFLDEPFRNVSEEYLEATAEFIRQLNKKLGIQIVLITHRKQLTEVADKVYEFSLKNGITNVMELGER